MARFSGRGLASAIVLAIATAVAGAEAAPSSSVIVVLVSRDAPGARADELASAVRAQLADMKVTVVVERTVAEDRDERARMDRAARLATENHALGTFYVDVADGGDVMLYLFDPKGARVLVRRARGAPSSAAATTEEAASIVRASVAALLEGAQIGLERPAPPRRADPAADATTKAAPSAAISPPPAPIEPPRVDSAADTARAPRTKVDASSPATLRLGAMYVGDVYADRASWQSGARFVGLLSLGHGFYASAAYAYYPSLTVSSDLASIRVARHAGELGAGFEIAGDRFGAAWDLSLVLDATLRSTVGTAANVEGAASQSAWGAGALGRMWGFWRFLPGQRLYAGAGLEVFPAPPRYVVADPNERVVFAPSVFRPRLDAGLTIDLF